MATKTGTPQASNKNTPRSPRTPRSTLITELAYMMVPSGLRTIAPFLEEAQSILRIYGDDGNKKITVFCIDRAFKLVSKFGLAVDEDSARVLRMFPES